jgi:hypothetical protein
MKVLLVAILATTVAEKSQHSQGFADFYCIFIIPPFVFQLLFDIACRL